MDNLLVGFVKQLLPQTPVFLAIMLGMVLALVFWRRCSKAAMLAMLGMGLYFVTAVVQSFVFVYIARGEYDWDHDVSWMFTANAVLGSIMRAVSFLFLVTAVFIGRKPTVAKVS